MANQLSQESLPYSRRAWSGNFWSGGQMSKSEDTGSGGRQSNQKSNCLFQPKYDGGFCARLGKLVASQNRKVCIVLTQDYSSTLSSTRTMTIIYYDSKIPSSTDSIFAWSLNCLASTSTSSSNKINSEVSAQLWFEYLPNSYSMVLRC